MGRLEKELGTGFRFLLHSRQDTHHQETLIQALKGEGCSTPGLAGSDGKVHGHHLPVFSWDQSLRR